MSWAFGEGNPCGFSTTLLVSTCEYEPITIQHEAISFPSREPTVVLRFKSLSCKDRSPPPLLPPVATDLRPRAVTDIEASWIMQFSTSSSSHFRRRINGSLPVLPPASLMVEVSMQTLSCVVLRRRSDGPGLRPRGRMVLCAEAVVTSERPFLGGGVRGLMTLNEIADAVKRAIQGNSAEDLT